MFLNELYTKFLMKSDSLCNDYFISQKTFYLHNGINFINLAFVFLFKMWMENFHYLDDITFLILKKKRDKPNKIVFEICKVNK